MGLGLGFRLRLRVRFRVNLRVNFFLHHFQVEKMWWVTGSLSNTI